MGKDELTEAFTQDGGKNSSMIEQIMVICDADHSGTIDEKEWVNGWMDSLYKGKRDQNDTLVTQNLILQIQHMIDQATAFHTVKKQAAAAAVSDETLAIGIGVVLMAVA